MKSSNNSIEDNVTASGLADAPHIPDGIPEGARSLRRDTAFGESDAPLQSTPNCAEG